MPILAPGIPVLNNPPTTLFPGVSVDTRSLYLRDLSGSPIVFSGGNEFIWLQGMENIETPARELVTSNVAGMDGEVIEEVRVGGRDVFLPVYLGSDSHLNYLADRAALRRAFNHRGVNVQFEGGTLDLVANSELGERTLRLMFVDGDTGYGTDSEGTDWVALGLKFRNALPQWYGERWTTPKIMRPRGFAWFGQFPPTLSSSRALGSDIGVSVGGDVESWPRIDLMGPCDSVSITGPGLQVLIPDGLAAGESAYIDTDPRPGHRVAMFNGVLDWTRIAPQRAFAPMLPGDNAFNLSLDAANDDTYAVVSGPSVWETPW